MDVAQRWRVPLTEFHACRHGIRQGQGADAWMIRQKRQPELAPCERPSRFATSWMDGPLHHGVEGVEAHLDRRKNGTVGG